METKPLTVGELGKLLAQFHEDAPVYIYHAGVIFVIRGVQPHEHAVVVEAE